MSTKAGRDLDTLSSFELARARPALATDLGRFTGASAIAELMLLFSGGHADPALYDALAAALDGIAAAEPGRARDATLAAAWRLIAMLGFSPELTHCAECHAAISADGVAIFSHAAGGALCPACGRRSPAGRKLPPAARAAIVHWTAGGQTSPLAEDEERAHQRLLREFLLHHVTDGRPLRAFDLWEHATWNRA